MTVPESAPVALAICGGARRSRLSGGAAMIPMAAAMEPWTAKDRSPVWSLWLIPAIFSAPWESCRLPSRADVAVTSALSGSSTVKRPLSAVIGNAPVIQMRVRLSPAKLPLASVIARLARFSGADRLKVNCAWLAVPSVMFFVTQFRVIFSKSGGQ